MSDKRFYIDLARCTNCLACQMACKDRANLPDGLDWLRIEARERGRYPRVEVAYYVTHCFHCAQAPCLASCPMQAIVRTAEGWVQVERKRCNGCGNCLAACPFGVIVLSPEGRAFKCDGCADEVALGEDPTCVRACPMRALAYSDQAPDWPKRVADGAFGDHGVGPRVTYVRRG
jgi:anaerobic dimethyl sulfoxide reductase subunit B (iron-sulfur subunit)